MGEYGKTWHFADDFSFVPIKTLADDAIRGFLFAKGDGNEIYSLARKQLVFAIGNCVGMLASTLAIHVHIFMHHAEGMAQPSVCGKIEGRGQRAIKLLYVCKKRWPTQSSQASTPMSVHSSSSFSLPFFFLLSLSVLLRMVYVMVTPGIGANVPRWERGN